MSEPVLEAVLELRTFLFGAVYENSVATARPQCGADGPGQLADAAANRFAGFLIEGNDFGHGFLTPGFDLRCH
jgi:hypothetical protein